MQRNASLDVAKGIAIILIVVFHASQGLIAANIEPRNFPAQWAEAFAYGFHVQIFFLLVGYFAYPRASDARYQADRFLSLYYPYLLWSALSIVSTMLLPGANHQHGLSDLLRMPVVPYYHFWFLLALIAVTLLLFLTRNTIVLLLGIVAALVLVSLGLDWNQVAYFFIFAAIGALLRIHDRLPRASLPLGLVGAAALLVAAYFATLNGISIKATGFVPVCLAGCYALYVLSDRLADTRAGGVLTYVGAQSLAIYLTHGFFATAARIVGGRLIPHSLWEIIWLGVAAAGVIGPLVLEWVARRLGIAAILGFMPIRYFSTRKAAPTVSATG